jgi:hypothetical protein
VRHLRLAPQRTSSNRTSRLRGRKQKLEGATVIDVSPNLRPKRARILDEP